MLRLSLRNIWSRKGRLVLTAIAVVLGALPVPADVAAAGADVSSSTGEATPERGGRAKRHFHLEADGLRALKSSHHAMSRMLEGLEGRLA